MKNTSRTQRFAVIGSFGTLCCMLAFVLGLQTSGNVRTFDKTQAAITDTAALRGDMDADGTLTTQDIILLLERADGLELATAEDIRTGDIDGDFQLTIKDALRLLRSLSAR